MRIKPLVALNVWILEFDDVTCIRSTGRGLYLFAIRFCPFVVLVPRLYRRFHVRSFCSILMFDRVFDLCLAVGSVFDCY